MSLTYAGLTSKGQALPTRIPLLDDYLGGGMKRGALIALWSEVEVDVSALALQIAHNRASEGDDVVFLTTTKKPKQVLTSLTELGLATPIDQLHFIDAFSATLQQHVHSLEPASIVVLTTPRDTRELEKALEGSLKNDGERGSPDENSGKAKLVIFDSFSAFLDRFDSPSAPLEMLELMKNKFEKSGATGIFVFTQWAYEKGLIERIQASFDTIVELRSTSDKPVYSMSVSTKSTGATNRLAYFRVLKPGGVRIHIPKIVVTGPFHAGKTSFIHSASKGAVSADRLGTTVALDFAHVPHKGFLIDIFGTPGQTRFDPILQKLGVQAVGVIIFVSATDRMGLYRVKSQMRIVDAEKLPYVVAVNKANLRGALSLEAVRNLMRIPKRVPLVPVHAKDLSAVRPNVPCELDPNDVGNVLDKVIAQITLAQNS